MLRDSVAGAMGDAFGRETISAWPGQAERVSVSRPSGADGARYVGLGLDEDEQSKLGRIYLVVFGRRD